MVDVSNADFLSALFAEDAPWAHVTGFTFDPGQIPSDQRLTAWAGDFVSRYSMPAAANQYFTISNFYTDDLGKARRRKALYRHTRVIVLDDVKEKLNMTEVSKLPQPSWILETSEGSEQWGYILNQPCKERARVENLLDGLVANGLAPDGKDPGMKGVTRYVRLPEGYNNKASKLVNGQPFKCRLTEWAPFNRVTLEQLAEPFTVNLNAQRREQRVDGAADIPDHPLLGVSDLLAVKEVRSDGRFDITCPWVDEHTGADDSGSAIFTNSDGTMGFKCHHGACQGRNGRDVLTFIEQQQPGFGAQLNEWKALRALANIRVADAPRQRSRVTFMTEEAAIDPPPSIPATVESPSPVSFLAEPSVTPTVEPTGNAFQLMLDALRREHPSSDKAREIVAELLKVLDGLSELEKLGWHNQVRDVMGWSKQDLTRILKGLRSEWYEATGDSDNEFLSVMLFVKELNQFYNCKTRTFYTVDAFQNSYVDKDAEVKKSALQYARVPKVDKLDYAPKQSRVFTDGHVTYGNTWSDVGECQGLRGDVTRWLTHWDALGWGEHRDHMLKFMAFTIKHPEQKINHMLLLGSGEGGGKDFLLYPLIKAMASNSTTIDGDELLSSFNDYLLNTKHLHINETELGDRKEAMAIGAKLKPIAAAPPLTLRVNPKGVKALAIRNIVNGTMTTNSRLPLRLSGPSRRFYATWSDINTRGSDGQMTDEWVTYWEDRWQWMMDGGAEACVWYLRNCVDVSDFNPGHAPPVTEFLKDIQEYSKSPVQRTISGFIEDEVGLFQCDLLSPSDMCNVLRLGDALAPHLMQTEGRNFTATRVGQALGDIGVHFQVRASQGRDTRMRLWVIRNHEKYRAMCGTELHDEYQRQLNSVRKDAGLRAVDSV